VLAGTRRLIRRRGEGKTSSFPTPARQSLVVFATLCAACHSYVPLTTPTPRPGTTVAATLTEAGSVSLSGYIGPDAAVVRGRLLGNGQQGMTLSVRAVVQRPGYELSWSGESVTLLHTAIARVDERRLSKGRSALLALTGTAALVALIRGFDLAVSGTSSRVTGGPGATPR
jgi:hypothetical protein